MAGLTEEPGLAIAAGVAGAIDVVSGAAAATALEDPRRWLSLLVEQGQHYHQRDGGCRCADQRFRPHRILHAS